MRIDPAGKRRQNLRNDFSHGMVATGCGLSIKTPSGAPGPAVATGPCRELSFTPPPP